MVIRVVDCETTGLSPKDGSEVIEIASVDLTKDFGITNRMQTFCKPRIGGISPKISSITHIIEADVKDAPTFEEVAPQFAGADVYVAHNAAFDGRFLPFMGAGKVICTMKAARRLWTKADSYSNQAIRYSLGLVEPFGMKREEIAPHRALSDVIVTAAILAYILRERRATFAQLVEWTGAPTAYATMPIGKFKGQPMSAVDGGWLEWFANGTSDDEDLKAACRAELQRRRAAA